MLRNKMNMNKGRKGQRAFFKPEGFDDFFDQNKDPYLTQPSVYSTF